MIQFFDNFITGTQCSESPFFLSSCVISVQCYATIIKILHIAFIKLNSIILIWFSNTKVEEEINEAYIDGSILVNNLL